MMSGVPWIVYCRPNTEVVAAKPLLMHTVETLQNGRSHGRRLYYTYLSTALDADYSA